MQILTQKIDTSKITDYCGVMYQDEPVVFVKNKEAEYTYALNIHENVAIPVEKLDPSKISEEVFFDNSIDLYEWALNKLKNEEYLVHVYYKAKYDRDEIKSDIVLKVTSKEDSFIRQALIDSFPPLLGFELLEFKIIG